MEKELAHLAGTAADPFNGMVITPEMFGARLAFAAAPAPFNPSTLALAGGRQPCDPSAGHVLLVVPEPFAAAASTQAAALSRCAACIAIGQLPTAMILRACVFQQSQ